MFRIVRTFFVIALLAVVLAAGWVLSRSADPVYVLQEWLGYPRFKRYDRLIVEVGRKREMDPMLIKAVIWRESAFQPDKVGKDGERGLMQVTEAAANDWARQDKIENLAPTDLFSPKTNLDAGTWYLKQALQRYAQKDDPTTFALAEYNAGRRRVEKWVSASKMGDRATAADLRDSISFPGTKKYVADIMARYRFYKSRGRL